MAHDLVIVPYLSSCDSLEAFLASFRTSIGIARALSGALVLPRFRGEVACDALVDTAGLSAIVPILSEVALAADNAKAGDEVQVACVSSSRTTMLDGTTTTSAARFLAEQSSSHIRALTLTRPRVTVLCWQPGSSPPLRSRAEVVQAFAPALSPPPPAAAERNATATRASGKRRRVLVLADLPATLLSASATIKIPDRALAMPAFGPRALADRVVAAALEATADPQGRSTALTERLVIAATGRLLAQEQEQNQQEAATLGTRDPTLPRVGLVVLVDGRGGTATDGATAAEAAALLIRAQPAIWQPQQQPAKQQQQQQQQQPAILVIDVALLRGTSQPSEAPPSAPPSAPELTAAADGSSFAADVASDLRQRGLHARALPTDALASGCGAHGAAPVALLAAALRWLCVSAPLLLLPEITAAPPGLVTARQALGRPVDHAYVPAADAALPSELYIPPPSEHVKPAAALEPSVNPGPPPAVASLTAASLTAASLTAASLTAALAAASSAAGVPVASFRAPDVSDAPPSNAAAAVDTSSALTASLTALAATRQSVPPPPPPALQLYDAFLARTAPKLQQLRFEPPPLPTPPDGGSDRADLGRRGRVAVIVEPRASDSIVRRTGYVIRNVGALLNARGGTEEGTEEGTEDAASASASAGWCVQFFHGTTNLAKVAALFSADEWSRVSCVGLGIDNLASSQEYSSLLASHWFWQRVGAEHVLIFQEDALLCGRAPRVLRELSDHFGYAGAPWEPYDAWVRGKAWLGAVGGNGGLSLRRRSQALACLDLAARQPGQWEDAYFVERLQQLGHEVMPASRARHLFVERAFGLEDARAEPLGLHKAYAYLSPPQLQRILDGLERCYDAEN